MLYKFKSKAAGDVIMTAPVGDAVLRAMGREPAAKGIFEAAMLAGLLQTLESAVLADEERRRPAADDLEDAPAQGAAGDGLSLKQRAWPLLEMMRRAASTGHDIVWGV
jgi:Domain of unknown function (DUF1840)